MKKLKLSQPGKIFRLTQTLCVNFAKDSKKHYGFLLSLSIAVIASLNSPLSTPVCIK